MESLRHLKPIRIRFFTEAKYTANISGLEVIEYLSRCSETQNRLNPSLSAEMASSNVSSNTYFDFCLLLQSRSRVY